MPNVKLYLDARLGPEVQAAIVADFADLRAHLCARLGVTPAACQLALITVTGMADQPQLNVELALMPHRDRTRAFLTAVGDELRLRFKALGVATVAIRISALDPETYIALK